MTYKILVSEIMLQQTQVAAVIPRYHILGAISRRKALAAVGKKMFARHGRVLGIIGEPEICKAATQVIELHGSKFPESFAIS